MAIGKRGLRSIVVDGVTYRWKVPRRQPYWDWFSGRFHFPVFFEGGGNMLDVHGVGTRQTTGFPVGSSLRKWSPT